MAKGHAMAKNTICLWYDKDAEAAARFYAATFPDSSVGAVHRAPSDYPSGKQGNQIVPCLQSLPQIFHRRVLSMTFRKTFNGGNDAVSELAIELWRLKSECVERRIGTSAFPGLGLCH